MYLIHLTEMEKHYFLDLAYGVIDKSEGLSSKDKALLNEYCKELSIDADQCNIDLSKSHDNLADALAKFTRIAARKIVYLEIIGLFLSDGHYNEHEQLIAKEMREHLELTDEIAEALFNVAKGFIDSYRKGAELISA